MLYNFEVGRRRTNAPRATTALDIRLVAPVQYVDGSGYGMGRLAPSPETALAEYLSIVNAEHDWDDVMTYEEGGQRDKVLLPELSVPFWLSEDTAGARRPRPSLERLTSFAARRQGPAG